MSAPGTSIAPLRAERTCRLVTWTPWPFENPSLIGHCAVSFTGGWRVHEIPVFRRADGSLSVGVPNLAQIDREGRIKLLPNGKRDYRAALSFETNEAKARWSRMVLGALIDAGIAPGLPALTEDAP